MKKHLLKNKQITLPSFLRRCLKAYAIKALIRSTKAELNRVGRSRNWQVTGNFEQLESISSLIQESEEESWQWVATLISKQRLTLTHEALIEIARKTEGMTINELMAKTDCTIAQARQVIDEIEWDE